MFANLSVPSTVFFSTNAYNRAASIMDRKEEIVKIMLFDTRPWSRRTMDLTEFILLSIELWTIGFAGWRVQSASPAREIKKQLALGP